MKFFKKVNNFLSKKFIIKLLKKNFNNLELKKITHKMEHVKELIITIIHAAVIQAFRTELTVKFVNITN